MPTTLDPYRDWLKITETARPLDHYQLLRLKKFEDDPPKVREHYRKMNAHVRKFAIGEFAKQSQDLLNELAKAMLCLTDAARKGEYDASLGRTQQAPGQRRTLEQILLGRKLIDANQLARARSYANAIGLEVRDAIVQQKLARPDVVMPAYAESLGLPYLDLDDIAFDESLMRQVPAVLARQHSCVPVMIDDTQLLVASPNMLSPEVEEELRLRTGKSVRTVLCTPASINGVIDKHYPREAAAAEMASGTVNRAGGRPAAAADTPGAGGARQDPAEIKKKKQVAAIISFNFTFMVVMLFQMGFSNHGFFMSLAVGMLLASAAAGTAWTVLGTKK